ncbi:RNA polymerase sigma-70 factor [Sphingobacterium pedocola]|uniref:RNA polymerase sigma-70 factor n=1 Tax=Sphingobacterium pedocola TaxID=2082722 RepID=A0ABR9T8S6_9SPHI|nr:RNA polymerase sigma-70 factor [Sphingobacterium pedocola]MBE8721489.1 hypothetical protein [Sphingobacterium pedocola]
MSENEEVYWINIRVREGDHQAFLEIYNRFNKTLYHFVKKFIQDTDVIDDTIHDAFLNLWNARHRIEGNHPIEGYLFRITRNLIFKQLKSQLKSAEAMVELRYFEEKRAVQQSVEQLVIHEEYEGIYELAIDRLPPQRKKIFIMSREKGLSYKEIAQFLEISPNTVKEHMSLAMKSIRDYIAKDHDVILKLLIFFLLFMDVTRS